LEKLTASQLAEWIAYDRLDPIGESRADFRMSYLSSLVTNLAIGINGKKGTKLTEVKDFILDWSGEAKESKTQSPEEMKSLFQAIAASSNKDAKKKEGLKNRPRPKGK